MTIVAPPSNRKGDTARALRQEKKLLLTNVQLRE